MLIMGICLCHDPQADSLCASFQIEKIQKEDELLRELEELQLD